MLETLKRRRAALDARLARSGRTHTLSLASYLLVERVRRAAAALPPGRVLDAGSGRSPYREDLRRRGCTILSIDVEDRGAGVDLVADLQHMPAVAGASMDGVLCTQVLEHVPRPWDAVAEIARVLRPGGWLLLSVPHLSPIHEAPHDYFRYTRYGLASLLEGRGLVVEAVEPAGGLVAFVMHGASAAAMSLAAALPLMSAPVLWLHYLLAVRALAPVDRWLGLRSLYPCNYVVVARKPASASAAR